MVKVCVFPWNIPFVPRTRVSLFWIPLPRGRALIHVSGFPYQRPRKMGPVILVIAQTRMPTLIERLWRTKPSPSKHGSIRGSKDDGLCRLIKAVVPAFLGPRNPLLQILTTWHIVLQLGRVAERSNLIARNPNVTPCVPGDFSMPRSVYAA